MKKLTLLLFSMGIFVSSTVAEQGTGSPPVAVLKYEWVHIQDLGLDSGLPDATVPALPVGTPGDRESPRGRSRQNPIRIAPPRDAIDDVAPNPRPRKDIYRYTVAIRNLAERPIAAVVWEYVVVDLRSRVELARLRFTTAKKISPGKTRKLSASTWTPPSQTTSVQGLQHPGGQSAGESVEICQIQYSDGSLWVRHSGPIKPTP